MKLKLNGITDIQGAVPLLRYKNTHGLSMYGDLID